MFESTPDDAPPSQIVVTLLKALLMRHKQRHKFRRCKRFRPWPGLFTILLVKKEKVL
jgi:hypothetical protein